MCASRPSTCRDRLRGKQPKLSKCQQKELRRMQSTGDYSISDLAELLSVSRPTVYRPLKRRQTAT
uniref:helix-turn-helix domain-containing protein n=1 Tax=Paracoccus sp. T5 TaxID=3402161 RepID=UPI003AE703CC